MLIYPLLYLKIFNFTGKFEQNVSCTATVFSSVQESVLYVPISLPG